MFKRQDCQVLCLSGHAFAHWFELTTLRKPAALYYRNDSLPRIGLLSDSHGRWPTTEMGVELLIEKGAQQLIHLGDIGNIEVIDAMACESPDTGEQIEAHVVFGNTDWDITELTDYAQDLGITVDHPLGWIELDQGALAFCHGHEDQVMESALGKGPRYLCHGHTHRMLDVMKGKTRIINPGALFRARQYTVALLDTDQDALEFFTLNDNS